jgi:hypothetical protein
MELPSTEPNRGGRPGSRALSLWRRGMPKYRTSFFKHLVNSNGAPFKVLQRIVETRDAKTIPDAEQFAKRSFERAERICDWRLHADTMETDTNQDDA